MFFLIFLFMYGRTRSSLPRSWSFSISWRFSSWQFFFWNEFMEFSERVFFYEHTKDHFIPEHSIFDLVSRYNCRSYVHIGLCAEWKVENTFLSTNTYFYIFIFSLSVVFIFKFSFHFILASRFRPAYFAVFFFKKVFKGVLS